MERLLVLCQQLSSSRREPGTVDAVVAKDFLLASGEWPAPQALMSRCRALRCWTDFR